MMTGIIWQYIQTSVKFEFAHFRWLIDGCNTLSRVYCHRFRVQIYQSNLLPYNCHHFPPNWMKRTVWVPVGRIARANSKLEFRCDRKMCFRKRYSTYFLVNFPRWMETHICFKSLCPFLGLVCKQNGRKIFGPVANLRRKRLFAVYCPGHGIFVTTKHAKLNHLLKMPVSPPESARNYG